MRSGPAPMPSSDKLYWSALVRAPPSHLGCLNSLHLTVRIWSKFLSHCDMQHCVNIKGPRRWLLESVSPRAAPGCKSARNARVILSNHVTGTPRPATHLYGIQGISFRGISFRGFPSGPVKLTRRVNDQHPAQISRCFSSGYRAAYERHSRPRLGLHTWLLFLPCMNGYLACLYSRGPGPALMNDAADAAMR